LKIVTKSSNQVFLLLLFSRFSIVGSGAYGVVVSAKDTESKDPEESLVAIKRIEHAFEHRTFMKRTLRELKVLRLLKHDNVF